MNELPVKPAIHSGIFLEGSSESGQQGKLAIGVVDESDVMRAAEHRKDVLSTVKVADREGLRPQAAAARVGLQVRRIH